MTEITKPAAIDQWPSRDLEEPIRELAFMAEIAPSCAHEVDWPSELTDGQHRDISRLLFLVRKVEDMAVEKTYDKAFPGDGAKSAV